MMSRPLLAALLAVLLPVLAHAGDAPPAAPAGSQARLVEDRLVQDAAPSGPPDARVEHLVAEDSQVRIEETRVRGLTTRIVVHSKLRGMGSYAIQPSNPGVDRENDPAAGKRLWTFGF